MFTEDLLTPCSHGIPSTALSIVLALIVHQIFRRHETYSILVHVFLLFGPPGVLVLHTASHTSSTSALVAALPASFAIYLTPLALSVLSYRMSPFHPLSRYPGPFINRLSKMRMAFLSLAGKQNVYIKNLHDYYGDVVRIGPNELSIRDPSLISGLLGSSGLRKGPHFFGRLLSPHVQTLIALQDTEEHIRRRRPWSRGFSPAALKEYEEFIAARVKQLGARLEEQTGTVALDGWINAFAYDFMYDMAFGGGSDMLNGEKNDFWEIVDKILSISTFLGHVPWLGIYLGHIPSVSANIRRFMDSCSEPVRKRMSHGSVKKDLFHYLNHEDVPEKEPPTMLQLVDDGVAAVTAGSDTVSTALSSLFASLMDQPRVYKRLQAEIDHFYPPGEDVFNTAHHREMRYLTAAINETLRLFPPAPCCTQRQEPHDSLGTTIGNLYIPPGTNIWVNAYSMHRDPRNFSPDPDLFWPERWLIASDMHSSTDSNNNYPIRNGAPPNANSLPPDYVASCSEKIGVPTSVGFAHNDSAFLPFSYGPMNCVGKNLAMLEMRTVVCALLQRFHIRAAEGFNMREYEKEYKDYFISARGSVSVILETRG